MFTTSRALLRARLVLALVALCLFSGTLPVQAVINQEALTTLEATQAAFRQVNTQVAPAVVTIFSTTQVRTSANTDQGDLFGAPSQSRTGRVSGSGVIIRANGIVLTNSHVVQDATKVTVQLPNSDKQLPAVVVQADQRTDLAIVRITQAGTYPTATLGNAQTVQVGDWAIAFGSPYRLPTTMTVGVISATGRKLEGPTGNFNYYDLIQTDASINHGNSGGPLVNTRGEVIGINFMIYSPGDSSGSIGIGFAIPINDYTKRIIDTLIAGRRFERGLVGIQIDALSDAMRQYFGVTEGGVLVQNVVPEQAGAKAGLRDEDVIVEFNGVKVTDPDQFVNLVQRMQPGSKVTMTVVRNKQRQQIIVVLGADSSTKTTDVVGVPNVDTENVGLSVTTLTPDMARKLKLTITKGVIVTGVTQGSPAEDAGLRRGHVILRVGGATVNDETEFWSALAKEMAISKVGVVLRITDGTTAMTVTLSQIDADTLEDEDTQ